MALSIFQNLWVDTNLNWKKAFVPKTYYSALILLFMEIYV